MKKIKIGLQKLVKLGRAFATDPKVYLFLVLKKILFLLLFPIHFLIRKFSPLVFLEYVTLILRKAKVNINVKGKLEKTSMLSKRKIYFFTCVWGRHVHLYDAILMRSLFQSGNIPSLLADGYSIELHVHTLESDVNEVIKVIDKYKATRCINDRILTTKLTSYHGNKIIQNNALIKTISLCIEHNAMFVPAAPDSFFGNYSIRNIVKLNMDRNLCIAGVHLRVNENEFLSLLKKYPHEISNPELVNLTFKSAHQNLYDSFIENEENCSYIGGIAIQKIDNNTYAVTHRLPTVYLANFNKSDLKYFSKKSFNCWDHEWPSLLMAESRYKLIGCSDLFYLAEATESNFHICENLKSFGNDDYQHKAQCFHKEINRNFVVILNSADI